jgi:hypothetical protein
MKEVCNNPLELHPGLKHDSYEWKCNPSFPLHHFHFALDGIAQELVWQWLHCQLAATALHPPWSMLQQRQQEK